MTRRKGNVYHLLTPSQLTQLPSLKDIETKNDEEMMVRYHFTSSRSSLQWFVIAYNKTRKEFFGLAESFELQLRSFTLHDLQGVVKDEDWTKRSLSVVRRELIAKRARR